MVRNDFGHEDGNLMRGVELASFLARIGGEHADQIFVDEAEHIVALAAIHWNVFDELNQFADGFGLLGGGVAELAQASFKGLENALEKALVVRVNQATKGRQGITYMRDIEVAFVLYPSGKQMLIGDEVANVAFDVVNGLSVAFGQGAEFFVAEVLAFCEAHQLVGEVFVKDEAEDVVLVLIGLDFRPHLVGRFPDFGSELLFVHCKNLLLA